MREKEKRGKKISSQGKGEAFVTMLSFLKEVLRGEGKKQQLLKCYKGKEGKFFSTILFPVGRNEGATKKEKVYSTRKGHYVLGGSETRTRWGEGGEKGTMEKKRKGKGGTRHVEGGFFKI